MRVLIKASTLQKAGMKRAHFLQKEVSFENLPVPERGDDVFVDGVFIQIEKRVIAPFPSGDPDDEHYIELFGRVDDDSFDELEAKGWTREE